MGERGGGGGEAGEGGGGEGGGSYVGEGEGGAHPLSVSAGYSKKTKKPG